MEAFATLAELQSRLDWVLDADEERMATGALEDASDLARAYGSNWEYASSAPRLVRTLVLTAVKRHMNNPEGLITSRAGDETMAYADIGDKAGAIFYTANEIKLLAGLGGRNGIVSVPVSAWGPTKKVSEGYVPTGQKPFPMFSSDSSPW